MAQVKKETVRNSILRSAKSLYMSNGYVNTSMSQIAKKARISTSNLYVYYKSKLDILFEVYEAWFVDQLDVLENKVARIRNPRKRLEVILFFFWRDIPGADNNFANNLVQALSAKTAKERYSRHLLLLSEARVSRILKPCLSENQQYWLQQDLLSHLLFMAHDGFTMNYNLESPAGRIVKADRVEKLVSGLCDLFFTDN
jgi:AcrR family transcriptional regulator